MTDEYIVVQSYCLVRKDNHFYRVEEIVKKLIEQEQRVKALEKENEQYRQILLDFGIRTVFKENTVLRDGDVE